MAWPDPVEVDGVTVEALHMEVLDFDARKLRVWVTWGDTIRSADVTIPDDKWDSAWRAHGDGKGRI